MIERRPIATLLAHVVLVLGVLIVAFPVYLTFVASTQSAQQIAASHPLSLIPGSHGPETYWRALFGGKNEFGSQLAAVAPVLLTRLPGHT